MSTIDPEEMLGGSKIEGNSIWSSLVVAREEIG